EQLAAIGDVKKFVSYFADDALVQTAGLPDAKGKDAISKLYQGYLDGFPDLKAAPWRVWQKDKVARVEWVTEGTHTKDWMGVKASNKPAGVNGLTVGWFNDDGTIKEAHVYFDMGTVMSQIGAPKAPPKARPVPAMPTSAEWHVAKGTADEDKNV